MQDQPTPTRKKPGRRANPPVFRVCGHCGVEFQKKPRTEGKFCSRACVQAWWTETRQQESSVQGNRRLNELRAQGRDPRATPKAAYKRRMAFRNSALTMDEKDDGLTDDQLWAERGDYWQDLADPPEGMPSLWERRDPKPLVLTGHGVRLRIRHGALEIRHGFTHYPQKARTQLLFPGDRRMPSRIVLIQPDGLVTFDVIEFLSRQRIPLVVLDWRGRPVTAFQSAISSTDLKLREAQLRALEDGTGIRIAIDLIRRKLAGSIRTLKSLPATTRTEDGINRLAMGLRVLDRDPPRETRSLMIVEARAAGAYFAGWLDLPIGWKGTGRHPIPPEWQRMPLRSSMFGDRNRHATHPVMAALNYCYGVLEGQVRGAAISAGLDPSIGYLHACQPGRHALVFDLLEPLRPLADRAVLDLIRSHTFSPGDVFLTERGVCRLHPQLARVLASSHVDAERVAAAVDEVVAVLRSEGVERPPSDRD